MTSPVGRGCFVLDCCRLPPFLAQSLNCVSWHLSQWTGHWGCQVLLAGKENRWHPLLLLFLIQRSFKLHFSPASPHYSLSTALCISSCTLSCWPLAFLWNKFLPLINVVLYIEKWFKISLFAEHFTCVVKMLYNLQFIQALAAISSKFSPEERQAWSTAGALKKVNRQHAHFGAEIYLVFDCLQGLAGESTGDWNTLS